MLVVLIAWAVLTLLLGVLIGKAIHRADVVQFPDRPEHAPWTAVPPRTAASPAAAEPPAEAGGSGLRAA